MKTLPILVILISLGLSVPLLADITAAIDKTTPEKPAISKQTDKLEEVQRKSAERSNSLEKSTEVKITEFRTVELQHCLLVGKSFRYSLSSGGENPVPGFWDKCFSDGTISLLEKHPQRIHNEVLIGWYGDYDPEDETIMCIVGVLTSPEARIPVGMTSIEIPTSRFAVATLIGQEPDVYMKAHQLTFEKMREQELIFDAERG